MATVQNVTSTQAGSNAGLAHEIGRLRLAVQAATAALDAGRTPPLPGNVCFLADGRVLCRPRARGDSRYPYGRDGFSFWVHASGHMHGNDGLFFPFLPFLEGHEPAIAFFAGLPGAAGDFTPIPLLPVPLLPESERVVRERYTVLGPDAAYFVVDTGPLFAAVRVFVDQTHAEHIDLVFSLHLENHTPTALDLYTSAYLNPFCRHQFAETCEDRWFKRIHVEPGPGRLPPFVVAVNEDVNRFRSVTNHALVRRATDCAAVDSTVCTSRLGYLGDPRGALAQAAPLRSGAFAAQVPLTVFNDNAIVGDLNHFTLAAGTATRFDYVFSVLRSAATFQEELRTSIQGASVDVAHARLQAELRDAPHQLHMRFADSRLAGIGAETLNHFLPFLITQVRVCAQTRGFMQPSPNSLIGIRDVFQAIEGHMYDQPELARQKIIEALGYVLIDGRCPRQYSLPVNGTPGRADLREFIDQGAWVVSALYTYIALTGDTALLNERLGYHRLADTGIAPAEGQDGTVLDHLIRIMGFLSRHRAPETGLLRALYGDWNDAVDGLGMTNDPGEPFGSGVSVMASLQFYQNCREMIEILQRYYPGQYLDLVRQYQQMQAELETHLRQHAVIRRGDAARIVHGWGDKQSYYVGSFQDSDGLARDSLTSNAFWVLSGLHAKDRTLRPHVLAALERLDSKYGLRTFAPGFAPDAPGVGRVCKLPVGTAENGACYVHAALFGIMALFRLGEPRAAWAQIQKILPFAPHQSGLSHSPFVMPNSYVYNPDLNLTGQNMNDWQTGSSNVLLKLMIRFVFGFAPEFDALRIAPAAWYPFERFDFGATAHGRQVRVVYTRQPASRRRFRLNGADLPGVADEDMHVAAVTIPYADLSPRKENIVEVIDPENS